MTIKLKPCSQCHELFGELENWGLFDFCSICAKKHEKLKAKKRQPSVGVETSTRYGSETDGTYNHKTGAIRFLGFRSDERLLEVLNHEYVHYLLNRFVSVRVSYQYDNISLYGELDRLSEL